MILLIDNYDSFVFNLARYFERLGHTTVVTRNDAIDVAAVSELAPQAIVLSPGPCTPSEAGVSLDLVRSLWQELPMLGICLGHQTVAAAFGATIARTPRPMHGQASSITHDGRGIFQNIPDPLTVGRYHSLVVTPDSIPDCLQVSAWAEETVMSVHHRDAPIVGLQFHPESILTECGYALLANFLRLAGLQSDMEPDFESELAARPETVPNLPDTPVTF
jgi:anthranilate synthase/aminodeoxychorismate synthase-like glutamine amidotransferase